jgi:hypothetical protein
MEGSIMTINSKTLALLAAAVIGTSLAACHRGGEDKSASNQDMNQAPKQGYTGPASPSTSPPSSTGSDTQPGQPSGSTGSPGSTNPSGSMQQPGSPENQPQQQQQQR